MDTSNNYPKILHLRASGALLGAENVVIEIAQHSQQYGFESIIGIPLLETDPKPDFASEAEKLELNVQIFHYSSTFSTALAKRIKHYVKENQVDLIHAHGYQEDFYAWFARLNIPLVATNHLWKKTDIKLKLYAWLDARILKRFDQVIAVSRPICHELTDAGISKNKVNLISNGVNIAKFSSQIEEAAKLTLKQSLGIPPNSVVIGMISSLTSEKGHRYAIQALKNALSRLSRSITLLIVGDGDYKNEIAREVDNLKISDHVIFTGTRRDIPEILSILDIYIISSLIEGLPISMLEAMASKLPVIASDVGDIGSVINDGENGYLVPATDTQAMTENIITLVNNPEIRQILAKNALTDIEKKYSAAAMTESYCNIYRNILIQ